MPNSNKVTGEWSLAAGVLKVQREEVWGLWRQTQFSHSYGPDRSDTPGRLFSQFFMSSPQCLFIIWVTLNALWWVKQCKNGKIGLTGSWEEPSGLLGFPIVLTVCLITAIIYLVIYLIQEQTVAMLLGHLAGKCQLIRDHLFAEAECTLFICHNFVDSVAAVFAWK